MNNITQWIEKVFSNQSLSTVEILGLMSELLESAESRELSEQPHFLYQLAKVHSEAAFILWQMQQQKRLHAWLTPLIPHIDLSKAQICTTQMFPHFHKKQIIMLREGQGTIHHFNDSLFKPVEKCLAFRSLGWRELISSSSSEFSFNQLDLDSLQGIEIQSIAAIIAGAKAKSFQISSAYAEKRIQGGRAIKDWSSIQNILSELYLSVKADEALMPTLSVSNAYFILKDADHFVSQNMQVLGGAGYMEDYVVERLYRECIFLKNWPRPYRAELINHYQTEVQSL